MTRPSGRASTRGIVTDFVMPCWFPPRSELVDPDNWRRGTSWMWEACLHWMKDGDDQQVVVLVGDEATCQPRYEKRRTKNMPQRADEHDTRTKSLATKRNLNNQKLDYRIPIYKIIILGLPIGRGEVERPTGRR